MKHFFLFILACIIGVMIGGYFVKRELASGLQNASIMDGPWRTSEFFGSQTADPKTRTMVANAGLFALNKSETIYYTAELDSEGAPLKAGCSYKVSGRAVKTRWWSLTAYGADYFLILNDDKLYSFHMGNVERNARGEFAIHVSKMKQGKNWLPLAADAKHNEGFTLTLRYYNPDRSIYDDLDKGVGWTIEKISGGEACDEAV